MKILIFAMLFFNLVLTAQTNYPEINKEIENGNFSKAEKMINEKLNSEGLSETERLDLEFQIERMDRIRKDFRKTSEDVLKYVKQYFPDADEETLKKWEDDGTLEYMVIDGEKKYFNRSHTNLFLVNKEAKDQKIKVAGKKADGLDLFLQKYIPEVLEEFQNNGKNLVKPEKIKINYKLTVDADAVPDGEIIRAWLPYPKENHKRQGDVKLISVNSDEYIIADDSNSHRSIYFEKKAQEGEPTLFEYSLSYTGYNEYQDLENIEIKRYNRNSELYKTYTTERKPHITFTDKIKNLSQEIVGDEKDPYQIAKKIFTWINNNIPWAGAREYSTIENISDYCISNMHGDCGIKTILFMTLARYNGIPVKWQSGWMLHPGQVNLHDWGEIYFEGIGWVPVDQSFGLVDSEDESVKYFFLGGIDAYHLIVNDDYSKPFFPAKIYPRSETVDFQRGEVEWRGGNLYFDKWDYHMDVVYNSESR